MGPRLGHVGLRRPLILAVASTASCTGLFGIEDLQFDPGAADASTLPRAARFCDAQRSAAYCEDFDGVDIGAPGTPGDGTSPSPRLELSGPESSATLTNRFFSPPRALAFGLTPDQPG